MATLPVHQPQMPFLGRIPGVLRNGSMIRIKGFMQQSTHSRFVINLQCGPAINPLDDVALHLSVRPAEFAIVRNHHEKFRWGSEERNGGCPIRRNHQFEILILAEHTGYKIAVDGTHYCDFRHRIPISRVNFIHIHGDTNISFVGMDGEMTGPCEQQHHHHYEQQQPVHPPHHHHHHHSPDRNSPHYIPTVPSAPPPIGIYPQYNPPVEVRPIYPNLPMPMPVPTPPPPPPYTPPYIHRPIEANPYPYAPSPTPYPVQESITVGNQYYTNNPNPGYIVTNQSSYPANTCYIEPKKNKHTALKIAAAAGGIGLGAYAISRVLKCDSSDSD